MQDTVRRQSFWEQLSLIGYSHGTQIMFNGMLAFSAQGSDNRNFLKQYVKVIFLGRMVSEPSMSLLSRMVSALKDSVNPGDLVSGTMGNLLPTINFTKSMTEVSVNLSSLTVQSALVDFISDLDIEEHKLYRYIQRFRQENFQNFF